jgi:hypothetical protein
MVANTTTVEQIAVIEPDYQSESFSISELMSRVKTLLETQNEKSNEDL